MSASGAAAAGGSGGGENANNKNAGTTANGKPSPIRGSGGGGGGGGSGTKISLSHITKPSSSSMIPPPTYVTASSSSMNNNKGKATTTAAIGKSVLPSGGAMNAEDFVLLAKQKQKEQQQQQERQQQQQQTVKVFGSDASHKPAFGKSPTPPPPAVPPAPAPAPAPSAPAASNPPPASTGQKKANVWTRPVANPPANGVPSPAKAAPAAVVPPPVSNGNATSNNNKNTGAPTGNVIKSSVATQTSASMIAKNNTTTNNNQQQHQTVGSNVSKGTPSPVAKKHQQQPQQPQQQQQQKEKAKSPLVEAAKSPKDPQPTGTATTKDATVSAGPENTTPATITSVTNKSVPAKLSSGAAVGGSQSNATNATTTTTTTNTTTTTKNTKVIPTQPLARGRASPPADAIYTENESLLTSPGPPEVQNNTDAKKSSTTTTTKAAAAPAAAPAVDTAAAGPVKEYRGKISCPACAKDFDGSSKLRLHVIKCRVAHAGGFKVGLLTDDKINTLVADKLREALQVGKDVAQQRKKDAAAAERTPSKAMTEATDDDSDSEEPKMFQPSKKQLNEKGKDGGDGKNNAASGKERSTLQGIEETLLGDGDSDSDDRDFVAHAADVALRKKKTPSKHRGGSSVRVTPDDALAERLLRDDVNFPPAETNSTRRDGNRGAGAKSANKLDDFESDDEQRAAVRTQKPNDKVPEALRCTRTNGVWRCSKEKVAGAMFCEKHLPKPAKSKAAKGKSGRGKETVDDIEPEKEDLLTEDDEEEDEEEETVVPDKKDTSFRGRKPHLLVSGDAVKKPVSLSGKALDCPHCGKHFEKNSPGRSSHIRSCEAKTRKAGGKIRNSVSLSPTPVKSVAKSKKAVAAPAPAPSSPPPSRKAAPASEFTCRKCGKVCGGRGPHTMHERSCKGVSSDKAPASSAFICEKCGKVCGGRGQLTMHARACRGDAGVSEPPVAEPPVAEPPVASSRKKRGRPADVPATAEVPAKLPKPTMKYKSNAGKPDWMCRARGGNWICHETKAPGDDNYCKKHAHMRKRKGANAPATEPAAAKKAKKTSVRISFQTKFCGYCIHEKFQERDDLVAHLKTRHGITDVVVSNLPVEGVPLMPKYDPDAAPEMRSPSPSPVPEPLPPARIAAAESAPVLFQQAPVEDAPRAVGDFTCKKCGKVCKTKGPFTMHVRSCKGTNAASNASKPAPAATKAEAPVGKVGTRRQQLKEPPSSDVGVASPSVPRKDVAVVSTERNERSSSLALAVANNTSSGGAVAAVADSAEIAKLLEIVNAQNARIQQQDIAIKKLADQCLLMSQNIKTGWLPPFDPTAEIKRIKAPGANPGYNPIIQFGRLLWLTGIVSRELSNDAGEQTLSALQNMKFMLTQAGTDLKHLLRVTLHVSDIRVMEKTASAWKEFFIKRNGMKEEDLPVRLTTQAVLKDPKFLVEVHAEAVVPEKKDDMKSAADGARAALGNA